MNMATPAPHRNTHTHESSEHQSAGIDHHEESSHACERVLVAGVPVKKVTASSSGSEYSQPPCDVFSKV